MPTGQQVLEMVKQIFQGKYNPWADIGNIMDAIDKLTPEEKRAIDAYIDDMLKLDEAPHG